MNENPTPGRRSEPTSPAPTSPETLSFRGSADPKPGVRTTEFWLTAVSNIAGAVLALLVAYGALREEESRLWLTLAQAVALTVIPLTLAWINSSYINGRSAVKRNDRA